jgi:arylsulfatase A-like enzyme
MIRRILIIVPTILVVLPAAWADTPQPTVRPNLLFIAVDDLRPQLACFGKQFMKTPNFDALAKRSVLFERAYCMVPTCGASRASLMTGLRPTPRRFVSYTARADKEAPQAITLNTHFKNNGYTTISLGKIFHFPDDNRNGWSEKPWRSSARQYRNQAAEKKAIRDHQAKYPGRKKVRGFAFESFDAPDEEYPDAQTASKAIEHLQQFGKSETPFFLAVGFLKPHLPFCAPKRYWDLYDYDSIDIPSNYGPPKGAPQGAVHSSGELRAYAGIPPQGPVDRETARHLIHGYYACVSFIDAQLGRLLAILDETGLAENTIIVLWGDHGWQLGEHGMWNKHSCFETSMHAPLFVAAPGSVEGISPGTRTRALTEFIDIYPSLCELAGIESPQHLEGQSFVPLMRNPSLPGKPYAVGRFTSGDTIRTDRYRYSEYRGDRGAGQLTGRMLYDQRTDPDENTNVVDESSNTSTVTALSEDLNQIKGKTPGH